MEEEGEEEEEDGDDDDDVDDDFVLINAILWITIRDTVWKVRIPGSNTCLWLSSLNSIRIKLCMNIELIGRINLFVIPREN
jgi:hypothetical protein